MYIKDIGNMAIFKKSQSRCPALVPPSPIMLEKLFFVCKVPSLILPAQK